MTNVAAKEHSSLTAGLWHSGEVARTQRGVASCTTSRTAHSTRRCMLAQSRLQQSDATWPATQMRCARAQRVTSDVQRRASLPPARPSRCACRPCRGAASRVIWSHTYTPVQTAGAFSWHPAPVGCGPTLLALPPFIHILRRGLGFGFLSFQKIWNREALPTYCGSPHSNFNWHNSHSHSDMVSRLDR